MLRDLVQKGGVPPRKDALDQPVGPDVLDAGDVVDGVGLATGASSASGCLVVSGGAVSETFAFTRNI